MEIFNMTRKELNTVLKYAEEYPDQRVMVVVKKKDGKHITNVDIDSFNIYSDAIVLNVEVGEDF
jgi:hypothetical protein